MNVKTLKDVLDKFKDEDKVVFKSGSGMEWTVNDQAMEKQSLENKPQNEYTIFIK